MSSLVLVSSSGNVNAKEVLMHDLIKISSSVIGDSEVNSVNLRDVHAFLEVGRDFSAWVKNRLEDFSQGIDYIVPQNGGAVKTGTYGQDRIDYIVTLDTAKHICMIERNDKGKQLRQHFIDCEKKLLNSHKAPIVPQTYAEALLEAGRLAMALEISEKEKQKALAQAEYQDKALGTSQIRNGLKTKENKKLQAKLRGYASEYASLTQYIAREKINAGKIDTRGIVKKLKTIIDHNELVLQTIEGDKFASNCFPLEFLDNNRENIEVMIEMLKQNMSLSDFIFEA